MIIYFITYPVKLSLLRIFISSMAVCLKASGATALVSKVQALALRVEASALRFWPRLHHCCCVLCLLL